MSLQKKENDLRKAQERLDKVNKRSKQFQIDFRREQNRNGRFRTRPHIIRGYKDYHGNNRGLIHKTVNLKYRIKGDKPSLTRYINSLEPATFKGKAGKGAAKVVNFVAHDVGRTAVDTALAAETVTLKTADAAGRELTNKLRQKYTREAVDDYHRGVFLMGRTSVDAVKGVRRHLKTKKQYKIEKAKLKLQRADNKLYKSKTHKPKMAENKAELKNAKAEFKSRIVTDRNNRYLRAFNKRRLQAYRQSKRELKFGRKQLKTEWKNRSKEYRHQKKIAKDSSPGLLALKPVSYTAGRMKASAWQKAINEDQDNDFLHAADSAKRRIIEPAKDKASKPQRLQREEKKHDILHDRKLKSEEKLKKQDSRLKDKHDSYKNHKRKKPKSKQKKSFSDLVKNAFRFVKNVYEQEVKKFFAVIVFPVLIIFLVFAFILMVFTSIFSQGGFTLGTYASQDYDLSEAEKYYTKLAYDMNEKIRKVSDTSDWKKGLADFGANKRDLKDKPDNWVWGRSSVYDWDPVYDFECYKLWSFLCAYYYDFDAADNGDIKYWKFKNDTKTLLEELFNAEYEFVYWYDNKSRWEELSPYNYWGGGNASTGSYYRADKEAYTYESEPYKYRFKPQAITSELSQYEDGDGFICINSDYRVLDPHEEYKETGFFIMDHRWYSGSSEPFYYHDPSTGQFYFMQGSDRHNRTFWGWGGDDAWFLVSPDDTHIWNSGLNDVCMYGYYEKYRWKTDCNLYYNVRQKKTFDEVIEEKLGSMSKHDERLAYYNLLVGNDSSAASLYGNHKTLHNLLPGETFRAYTLKQGFGYEMNGWNTDSSGLYQGIKLYCTNGEKLTAPFDCKITEVDTADNKIKLRKDDVEYWYDGTGGTKRDTEVTISNAVLIGSYKKGDKLKLGEEFAKTTAGNVNFHVYLDTDGYGWDYIDPQLVLY